MEKLIISPEQEKALNKYHKNTPDTSRMYCFVTNNHHWNDDYKSLKEFTLDEFARLLYESDSYTVVSFLQSTVTEGDIVVRLCPIHGAENDYPKGFIFIAQKVMEGKVLDGLGFVHRIDELRYPTAEEYIDFVQPKLYEGGTMR